VKRPTIEELVWSHSWQRTWSCIGEAHVLRHNMRVMVTAEPEEREKASQVVADQISALTWAAYAFMGGDV
jgi:hypothetical protein